MKKYILTLLFIFTFFSLSLVYGAFSPSITGPATVDINNTFTITVNFGQKIRCF